MRRRKFFAAALTAAIGLSTWARAAGLSNLAGHALSGGGHMLAQPDNPYVPPAGALDQQITLTNPAGEPTHTNPFFSFGMPIARSEYPATGYKLALYDLTGTTKITDCQVDMAASGWTADGSRNYAVVTGYATGTTLAAGSTATFRLKAIPGTPPATPVCTAATLAANSDIKAVCKIGTDTYTVSVNTIIAATPAASYPQTYVRQWKSGPVACEWCFGQFLQRDSDSAFHRWAFLKIYVTALSASGPYIIRGYLEDVQSYGPNPTGTIGNATNTSMLVVVDSIEIYNGATLICAAGGQNDLNNATFGPSGVDLTHGEINATYPDGLANAKAAWGTLRNTVGFLTTGTLPGGIGSFATTTYWAVWDSSTSQVIPCLTRNWATRISAGGFTKMAAPTAGLAVAINRWIYSNGGVYFSSTAGVSTGAQPTGALFADNSAGGTLVWTLMSAQMTSQGTGTHTMAQKNSIWSASKVPIMGPDTYPYWVGAGALPKLLVGYDRDYLFKHTMCAVPLDPNITAFTPWQGALPRFVQNMTYLPGNLNVFDIADGGEATMDERVNLFSPTALASMVLPEDRGMAMSCRLMALSFVDRNACYRDERTQEIAVANFGPNRLGSNYPGMPPTNSGFHAGVANTGSPKMIFFATNGVNWTGYGGDYSTCAVPDIAHSPNTAYWPALTSGDPLFFDALIEFAGLAYSNPGSGQQVRTALFGGVNLCWPWALFQQTRGAGHQLQIVGQSSWIIPDAHPSKPYFSDVMDDGGVIGPLWVAAHVGPNGQSVGYMPFAYPQPAPSNIQGQEPWMMGYLHNAMLQEVLKDNRPGYKSFLESYFYLSLLPLFDSDVGGSLQLIDAQWNIIGNATIATIPPTEAQFYLNVPDRLAGSPTVIFHAMTVIPPPTQQFINGIQSAQNTTYVYRIPGLNGQAFPGNAYGLSNRAVCQMGKMAGMAPYTKLADRIETFMNTNYAIPCAWGGQGPTAGQPFTSPGNCNGVMYAMLAQ